MGTFSSALGLVHAVAAAAACSHVLLYYRRPGAAVAWLFANLFLPLVGPLAYLTLAIYEGPRSIRRRRKEASGLRADRRSGSGPDGAYPEGLAARGFPHLMQQVCSFPLVVGNDIELVHDDREALRRQLEAIGGARTEVLVQTYVLKPGPVRAALFEALEERAAAGVRTRLLADPIGSQQTRRATFQELSRRGVEARTFLRPNPFKGRFQINFRNHRKILCVDGTTAFTGGRNWADEYYTEYGGGRAFRDTTLAVGGPVVAQMRRMFLEDWAVAAEDERCLAETLPAPGPAGRIPARVLPSGSDELRDNPLDVLGGAIRAARASVLVVTPYFVPGNTLLQALRLAAMSGVAVDVLMPDSCEKPSIDLTARTYCESLLAAGARIHLTPLPVLHAKAVVVDGHWCSVGSLNFDARSVHLNYELNLEVLDTGFADDLRTWLQPAFDDAEPVDLAAFRRRGLRRRVMEKAAALFEPLM